LRLTSFIFGTYRPQPIWFESRKLPAQIRFGQFRFYGHPKTNTFLIGSDLRLTRLA